jgi:hypothetical protein
MCVACKKQPWPSRRVRRRSMRRRGAERHAGSQGGSWFLSSVRGHKKSRISYEMRDDV